MPGIFLRENKLRLTSSFLSYFSVFFAFLQHNLYHLDESLSCCVHEWHKMYAEEAFLSLKPLFWTNPIPAEKMQEAK